MSVKIALVDHSLQIFKPSDVLRFIQFSKVKSLRFTVKSISKVEHNVINVPESVWKCYFYTAMNLPCPETSRNFACVLLQTSHVYHPPSSVFKLDMLKTFLETNFIFLSSTLYFISFFVFANHKVAFSDVLIAQLKVIHSP